MDCILLAGNSHMEGEMLVYTQGRVRAFIDMGGRSMLERVVDALQGSRSVDDITVVGLPEADRAAFRFERPVHHLPDHGSMVKNAMAGLTLLQSRQPEATAALLCSVDIPHITPEAIDDFVAACQPFDHLFYQPYVSEATLKSAYPEARPTWEDWRKEGRLYAGDLFMVNLRILGTAPELWEAFEQRAWGRFPQFAPEITRRFGAEAWQRLAAVEFTDEEEFLVMSALVGDDKTMKNIFTSHAGLALDADTPHFVELLRKKYLSS